jgi:tetratricopeptide (TPR) repeat protein
MVPSMNPQRNKLLSLAYLTFILFLILLCPGCGKLMSIFGHQSSQDSFLENTSQPSTGDMDNFKAGLKPIDGEIKAKYLLARHFQKLNQHLNAIQELNEIIKNEPYFPEAYNALGVSYDSLGKFSMAEECYNMALHLNPRLAYVVNNLGYSYMMQGKHENAVKYLEMAVAMEENNAKYRNNLLLASQKIENRGQKQSTVSISQIESQKNPKKQIDSEPLINLAVSKAIQISKVEVTEIKDQINEIQDSEKESRVITIAKVSDEGIFTQYIDTKSHGQTPEKFPDDVAIEIVNGNGINGFARKMENYLKEKGYNIRNLRNAEHFNHQETRIYFHKNLKESAFLLSKELSDENLILNINLIRHDEKLIRIFLGKDMAKLFHGSDQAYQIEISNGNGINGAARKMAAYLRGKGFPVNHLTNADHFNHKATRIFFGKGQLSNAQELFDILPEGHHASMTEMDQEAKRIRLLIGKDVTLR